MLRSVCGRMTFQECEKGIILGGGKVTNFEIVRDVQKVGGGDHPYSVIRSEMDSSTWGGRGEVGQNRKFPAGGKGGG